MYFYYLEIKIQGDIEKISFFFFFSFSIDCIVNSIENIQ